MSAFYIFGDILPSGPLHRIISQLQGGEGGSMIGQVFLHPIGIRNHAIFSLLPVCRTNMTFMHADELESLENPHRFGHGTAYGEAIDRGVHHYPLTVDEKKPSQGNTFIPHQDIIIPGSNLIQVREERIVEVPAQAPILPLRFDPSLVNID
jgi:hypothetical protein